MPTTTTTALRPGAVPEVDIPDPPLRPIPRPPRNVNAPQIDAPTFSRGPARRPDTPVAPEPGPPPTITLSTVVTHRNRLITISATNLTVDQFCDLLDKRGFAP